MLGSPKRNGRKTKRGFQDRGQLIAVTLANMRVRMGVAAPLGGRSSSGAGGRRIRVELS